MPLADKTLLLPAHQKGSVPVQEPLDIPRTDLQGLIREGFSQKGRNLRQILPPVDPNRFQVGAVLLLPADFRNPVHLRDLSGQPLGQVGRQGDIGIDEAVEQAILGEPLHLHGIVDDFSFPTDGQAVSAPANLHDPEIDSGAVAAVEPHLLVAEKAPPVQGRKVEKTEIHRFFDFVHMAIGEIKPGNMGLPELDLRCFFRVSFRVEERLVENPGVHPCSVLEGLGIKSKAGIERR